MSNKQTKQLIVKVETKRRFDNLTLDTYEHVFDSYNAARDVYKHQLNSALDATGDKEAFRKGVVTTENNWCHFKGSNREVMVSITPIIKGGDRDDR